MPTASKSLCQCGTVKNGSQCRRCGSGKRGHHKKTVERGYDGPWNRLSKRVRQTNPLCVSCHRRGRVSLAESVHHITKVKDAPDLRLEIDNTLAVCNECHAELDQLYEDDRAKYEAVVTELRKEMRCSE